MIAINPFHLIKFKKNLIVIQLNDAIDKKDGSNVPRRSVQLLSTPQIISLSCDHTMLAVTYTLDGSAFIDIYSVQSFLSTVSVSNKYVTSAGNILIECNLFFSLHRRMCYVYCKRFVLAEITMSTLNKYYGIR